MPNNQIYEILDKFNSYHDRLRFTVEHNYDDTMNFLDVNLRILEGLIRFDNYRKPTNSGCYLNYKSNPLEHKKGLIIGQLDRILFLAHPEYHKKILSL